MSSVSRSVVKLIASFSVGFALAITIAHSRYEQYTSQRINVPGTTAMADVDFAPVKLILSGWHRSMPDRLKQFSGEYDRIGWETLQFLEINLIQTQNVDLSFLSEARYLRHITIVGAQITPQDVRLILKSENLVEVRLIDCGDASHVLDVLKDKRGIEIVDLSSSVVSDKSLRGFAAAFSGSLNHLNVAGGGISDETIDLLRGRFPEARLTVNSTWYDR